MPLPKMVGGLPGEVPHGLGSPSADYLLRYRTSAGMPDLSSERARARLGWRETLPLEDQAVLKQHDERPTKPAGTSAKAAAPQRRRPAPKAATAPATDAPAPREAPPRRQCSHSDSPRTTEGRCKLCRREYAHAHYLRTKEQAA